MKKILKDWFTTGNGQDYDLGRALWALTAITPLAVAVAQVTGSVISLWRPVPLALWSAQDWTIWSGGVSGVLLAGAGALAIKKGTEPSSEIKRIATVERDDARLQETEQLHG